MNDHQVGKICLDIEDCQEEALAFLGLKEGQPIEFTVTAWTYYGDFEDFSLFVGDKEMPRELLSEKQIDSAFQIAYQGVLDTFPEEDTYGMERLAF